MVWCRRASGQTKPLMSIEESRKEVEAEIAEGSTSPDLAAAATLKRASEAADVDVQNIEARVAELRDKLNKAEIAFGKGLERREKRRQTAASYRAAYNAEISRVIAARKPVVYAWYGYGKFLYSLDQITWTTNPSGVPDEAV